MKKSKITLLTLSFMLFMLMIFAGCGELLVPVENIILDNSRARLFIGDTLQLNATIIPDTATDQLISWSSSDTSVATVEDGLVTAIAIGESTITATTADGAKSASCVITVEERFADSISLSHESLALYINDVYELGATILPDNTTNKTITWSSSDTSVATVEDGVVTALSIGESTITATTADGAKSASCIITVEERFADSISLSHESLALYINDVYELGATILPDNTTNKTITWSSSDTSVATVEDGVVTALSIGTASISATTSDGSKSAVCTIIIQDKNAFITPTGGYDDSEVTIKFYHTMGTKLASVLEKHIVEFNKIYPNIHIEHTQVGGYDDVRDTVLTELENGQAPNLAYCYPDHVALYNLSGKVAILDNLINSTEATPDGGILGLTDAQKADFIKGFYDEGAQFGDGMMYTMPFSKSTEVLYYNKTFFDENGLTPPTTWDELETVMAKIKEIDPDCIPLGYDSESNWFITMCEQLGSPYTSADPSNHFLFDNETNRGFVEKFKTWWNKGYIITQEIYGGYTSGLLVDSNSYMCISSSASAIHHRPEKVNGEYSFEVGIVPIPQMNASNPKVISQGPSIVIFEKENPQEVVASWLFVKYLTTSVEFQAEFSIASGYMPVLKSVENNPIYAEYLAKADGGANISALSLKQCLAQNTAYFAIPAFIGSSTARDQVGRLLIACLTGTKTIDQAFADALQACNPATT